MSDRVLGILVMATGALAAFGVLPIRIGMPPANRYWQTRPTKFALISRLGGFLFFVSAGAFIAWHEKMPERYRVYFLFPFLLGFVLAVAGQAMEKRVNPGPTIAALTLPDEPIRQRRQSNLGLIVAAGVVVIFGIMLWSYFHH